MRDDNYSGAWQRFRTACGEAIETYYTALQREETTRGALAKLAAMDSATPEIAAAGASESCTPAS